MTSQNPRPGPTAGPDGKYPMLLQDKERYPASFSSLFGPILQERAIWLVLSYTVSGDLK